MSAIVTLPLISHNEASCFRNSYFHFFGQHTKANSELQNAMREWNKVTLCFFYFALSGPPVHEWMQTTNRQKIGQSTVFQTLKSRRQHIHGRPFDFSVNYSQKNQREMINMIHEKTFEKRHFQKYAHCLTILPSISFWLPLAWQLAWLLTGMKFDPVISFHWWWSYQATLSCSTYKKHPAINLRFKGYFQHGWVCLQSMHIALFSCNGFVSQVCLVL